MKHDTNPWTAHNGYAIGFEPMIRKLGEFAENFPKIPTYPPINVKKVDDEHYVIEMAVAGFGKSDLDIELKEDTLTVSGNVDSEENDYLYKGIADRAFTRKFTVADSVIVKNAELTNGLLKIFLERFIPEEKKPRKIDINDPFGFGQTAQFLAEQAKNVWDSKKDD